jgi:tryptophan synthase beta chain
MATIAPERLERPNKEGRFGSFGGRYVPETLITALDELTAAYEEASNDPAFQASL